MRSLYKYIKDLLIDLVVVGYLIFEEFIWNKIARPLYNIINSVNYYHTFLDYIEYSFNRYFILLFFVVLFTVSEVVGLLAFYELANNHIISFIVLYFIKYIPVIFAFAILKRGKKKLFSFSWFRRVYLYVIKIIKILKSTRIYKKMQKLASEYINTLRVLSGR